MRTGNYYHPDKKLAALKNVTFNDFLAFHRIIFQRIKFLWFFAGNLQEKDVIDAVAEIEQTFTAKREGVKVTPLQDYEIPEVRVAEIPNDSTWVYEYNLHRENQSEAPNSNSAIFEIYQSKVHSDKVRVMNDILDNYLRDSFFDQLRTNEQLGYVVYCHATLIRGVNHFGFMIQSDVKWPQFLRQRIASFFETIKQNVQNLSDEEYEKYLESVKTQYLEKPLTLADEAEKHWDEIKTQQYFFDRWPKYAESLPNIHKSEFQAYAKELLFEAPRKLEIHVVSELMKEENDKVKSESQDKLNYVPSEETFRKRMRLYPDFIPQVKP